jgi:hypothetical protein
MWMARNASKGTGLAKLPYLMLIVLVALLIPEQAWAASAAEFSPSVRKAYDKVVGSAAGTLQSELKAQDERLQAMQEQDRKLDADITGIHRTNEELLKSIQARTKTAEQERIAKLSQTVTETKAKYKPLFTLQTALNTQLTAAKKLKNKTLTAALEDQIDTVKAAALLAREDIRYKESLYTKGKADKNKKSKEIRTILEDIDGIKDRVQTAKSTSVQTGKQITSGLKSLASIAKQGDGQRTLTSVSSLVALTDQLLNQKSAVISLENKVRSVLDKAEAALAAD